MGKETASNGWLNLAASKRRVQPEKVGIRAGIVTACTTQPQTPWHWPQSQSSQQEQSSPFADIWPDMAECAIG